MNTKLPFTLDTIQGLFDADASFEAKVSIGTQKPISFHVNIIFSQKEKDLLQKVLDTTGALNSRGQALKDKKISARNILNLSGTKSIGSSISIAFSSPGGCILLEAWKTQPPQAPTKYLDYCIAKILAELAEKHNNTATKIVNKYLPNMVIQDELIAGLSLLWLRYRMFGATKSNRNPKLTPIEKYYNKLGATKDQIEQSIDIGEQLYKPIAQNVASHVASLIISDDYLVGYHIGDGSFSIQMVFGANGKSFSAHFNWTLTDCKDNEPLLLAIKKKLEFAGIEPIGKTDYVTYLKIQLSNAKSCLKLVNLWQNKIFSSVRQNQYDCFCRALEIYNSQNFRKDLKSLQEFVQPRWGLAYESRYN